ncbi:MAG: hypothetical protein Edafosvirus11_26 [Edafosvirus sp.]|uniref:tRNAHis guanylyltransferase catalytic domain-containing protein n=1 Tax=Edafosvirus sp. TaxID=2487765 RepID=A0A3G4ZWM4_9VIRU|nr:MAG: hypothetical protein Edafosvirus11_26 [Edafosvirus sp.]
MATVDDKLVLYDTLKKQITDSFIEMAVYHIGNYNHYLTFEYNETMEKIFDKISDDVIKATEVFRSLKIKKDFKKDELISMLEDIPRKVGGYNVPLMLDMMFRADGHSFSKLFNVFKKSDLQPFSLAITQSFVDLVKQFSKTNEFTPFQTYFLCSDEITGLSKHGAMTKDMQLGMHPFGAKRDKVTSMISATLSANFKDILAQYTDEDIVSKTSEQRKSYPTFDARVFPTNKKLVGKMFYSRIQSCYRNSVSEFHDYFFGTKAGHGINTKDKIKHMADEHKFDYEIMCPPCLKYGIFIKSGTAIVPLKKPINDDKFVDFLYSLDDDEKNIPFEYILFDDMLALYPDGHYISADILKLKKDKYDNDLKLQKQRELDKLEAGKKYVNPDKEEVLRLRKLKKDKKKQIVSG